MSKEESYDSRPGPLNLLWWTYEGVRDKRDDGQNPLGRHPQPGPFVLAPAQYLN